MKIYIVTFFGGNYGSILQAYALQSKLREYGASPVIISEREPKKKSSKLLSLWRIIRPEKHYSILQMLQRHLQRKDFRVKRQKLLQFVRTNLSVKDIVDREDFIRCLSPQDVFLAGSDQIWNVLNKPLSDWYSLHWIGDKYKKYSYAASIGLSSLTKKQEKDYSIGLSGFQTISLREGQAVKALLPIFPDKVRQDLDPTLLYDSSFWRKIESKRLSEEPYVFVYMLRPDKRVVEIAKDIAKKNNCKTIYTGNYSYKYEDVQTVCDAGIEEFLSYIDHADAVVTNSFHGTAFSVLFEKPFLSVKIASTSSRVESLLDMLGLTSQLVGDVNRDYSLKIDYVYPKSVLEKQRERSLDYLRNICRFRI